MKKLIIINLLIVFCSCNTYLGSELVVIKPNNKIYYNNKTFLNKIYKIQKKENKIPMNRLKLFNGMRKDCIKKFKIMNKNYTDYDIIFILESYNEQSGGINGRIWSKDNAIDFLYQNDINNYCVKHNNWFWSNNNKELKYELIEKWDTINIQKMNKEQKILGGVTYYATRIIKTKKNKNLIIDCFTFQQLPNELPF